MKQKRDRKAMLFEYGRDIIKLHFRRRANLYIKPLFINFIATYRCNAKCIMCNIWRRYAENDNLSKEELSVGEIEKFIIDNINEFDKLKTVGFTGGEPLLMRSDFVEIVRVFRKKLPYVRLGVQTNGLMPELANERLKEILSFYPAFSLAVSIDGIGDKHSKVRGVPDAFKKATQTINYAKQLGIKNITCGMTLNKLNYKDINQIRDYVQALGAEFSCFSAEVSEYFNNDLIKDNLSLDEEELREVIRQLSACCGYHYFMDNLRLQLEGKRKRLLPCFSGFTSLVIDPYGNVKPCVIRVKGIEEETFGNLKNSLLRDMLTSLKAKRIKEKIKECSCWCQCEVSSSCLVAPFDIARWFLFYCRDKKGFLLHILNKKDKYPSLL